MTFLQLCSKIGGFASLVFGARVILRWYNQQRIIGSHTVDFRELEKIREQVVLKETAPMNLPFGKDDIFIPM